ncbi:coiled-coil domain-containing protein 62 isoform X4 [Hydra vulgaris]|uniref:Coiled-coil domain-containing protein 62 isoform X4 n=3 Tax=Hydra vulgaris TaxID=6087 RepID=A0ABM4CR21_HYDVU
MNILPNFQSTPLKGEDKLEDSKTGRIINNGKGSDIPFIYTSVGREYLNLIKQNSEEGCAIKFTANSMPQNGLNEQNTIYQQRKELQLMIQELKIRDKELNDMVHSHHKQLISWEMDKKHMRFLEKELSKNKIELKRRHEQIKQLRERLKVCESGAQSKSHELETTQIHLQQITFKASQSSNQLLEIEMKNKSLKNSVEELSSTVANLQGRDQKTTTLLRLKEKDLCDANKKIDELLEKIENYKETCQELKEKETGYKNEVETFRNENSGLKIEVENLKKSVSQLHTSISHEDISQLKQENIFLQKELFHAGEREKRKECLIELSKSRQERTEAELGHMRQLYDNVQREILLLKHKIATNDDSFSIASDLESSFCYSGMEKMSHAGSISSEEKREREDFLLEKVNLHSKSYEMEDLTRMSASELMNHCKWKLESTNGELHYKSETPPKSQVQPLNTSLDP